MGLEHYLCNHGDATVFDLGKGYWSELFDRPGVLDTPENIKKVIVENLSDPDHSYCLTMAQAIFKFTKGVPAHDLELIHDSGDDYMYTRYLKYECVGSRYGLNDPIENKRIIDFENEHLSKDCLYTDLSQYEIDSLKERGWNFKNVQPKLRSRFELLKEEL